MTKIVSIFEVFDTDSDGITIQGYSVIISNPAHTVDDTHKFFKRLHNATKFVKTLPNGTAVFLPNGNLVTLPNNDLG